MKDQKQDPMEITRNTNDRAKRN